MVFSITRHSTIEPDSTWYGAGRLGIGHQCGGNPGSRPPSSRSSTLGVLGAADAHRRSGGGRWRPGCLASPLRSLTDSSCDVCRSAGWRRTPPATSDQLLRKTPRGRLSCHARRSQGTGPVHRAPAGRRAALPPGRARPSSRLTALPRDQAHCYALARLGTSVGKLYEILLVDRS
jgi:hypothetical protein